MRNFKWNPIIAGGMQISTATMRTVWIVLKTENRTAQTVNLFKVYIIYGNQNSERDI